MTKRPSRFLCAFMVLAILVTAVPTASAAEESYRLDLSGFLHNDARRQYVEKMVDYHLRNDSAIRQTLQEGYSAVFFFEGCSDNMDDPELSDISYYRVSAVCLALKLDEEGDPYLSYFNKDCSTLPDRPLEYGAWQIENVGEVGPATICDGTYELFSVKHGGKYEALHLRTDEEDDTIPAIYMTPERYVTSRADMINIHTRNVNHTIEGAMWSAGCMLIGDGEFGKFTELIESTYYAVYDSFDIGKRVGTVTIDRQFLKEELYALYESQDAVDHILAASRQTLPETYLRQCEAMTYEASGPIWTNTETALMSLPCSNATDARSIPLAQLEKGHELTITGCLKNSVGGIWFEVWENGGPAYVYTGDAEQPGWFDRLVKKLFG